MLKIGLFEERYLVALRGGHKWGVSLFQHLIARRAHCSCKACVIAMGVLLLLLCLYNWEIFWINLVERQKCFRQTYGWGKLWDDAERLIVRESVVWCRNLPTGYCDWMSVQEPSISGMQNLFGKRSWCSAWNATEEVFEPTEKLGWSREFSAWIWQLVQFANRDDLAPWRSTFSIFYL